MVEGGEPHKVRFSNMGSVEQNKDFVANQLNEYLDQEMIREYAGKPSRVISLLGGG
jgi:hypothetical protein